MNIILASKSPRRREVMTWMDIPFATEVCTEPELVPDGLSPEQTVRLLSKQKAQFVFQRHPDAIVLGSDTVVDLNGEILGKPDSPEQAKEYLRRLSGRTHTVYTGVALLKEGYEDVRCVTTKVTFRTMTEREIDWYVSTKDPLDKAGAYGIQGLGCVFVDRIEGNYFNVIGLPAPVVYEMLLNAHAITEDRTEV